MRALRVVTLVLGLHASALAAATSITATAQASHNPIVGTWMSIMRNPGSGAGEGVMILRFHAGGGYEARVDTKAAHNGYGAGTFLYSGHYRLAGGMLQWQATSATICVGGVCQPSPYVDQRLMSGQGQLQLGGNGQLILSGTVFQRIG